MDKKEKCEIETEQERPGRRIPDPEKKILFAVSGNQCAFPGCRQRLIEFSSSSTGSPAVLAKIAHIVAHSERGPRGDPSYPIDKLNIHENLILLCPTCHDLIDRLPYQYNVHVLRQIKLDHEAALRGRNNDDKAQQRRLTDQIFASAMPITHVPARVFSAKTPFRKQTVKDLLAALKTTDDRHNVLAFELRDDRIYAFHNLTRQDGPFAAVCDPKSTDSLLADEMWPNPDDNRLYVTLMNRALTRFLNSKGVRYQTRHHRHYFLADKKMVVRSLNYVSLAGRRESRMVVWNPITKITGKPKKYWIHLAARFNFQQPGKAMWILSIRPERYLTKDGYSELDPDKIGSRVTRLKATMHNRAYFGEVRFWSQFLCEGRPSLVLNFDRQHLMVENVLLDSTITWPGIPDDDKKVVDIQPEEDLFSLAERRSISDELDTDADEEEPDDE